MLGTFVEISVSGPGACAALIEAGFDAVAQVARAMSFHDPDSDISRINAAKAGDVVQVHAWTWAVLSFALALFAESEGAFDCTVGRELVARGLLPRHTGAMPHAAPISQGAFDESIALREDGWVEVRQAVCLDLGGVAKGFAVDMAVEALLARGATQGVVNAGGDLRAFGEAAVPVHIQQDDDGTRRGPRAPVYAGLLGDGALATSSGVRDATRHTAGALVDPHRRKPARRPRTYSVIAPTCMAADALTKVVALRRRADDAVAARCLRTHGAEALAA